MRASSIAILLAVAALAIAPVVLGVYHVYALNIILINIVIAIGLNILIGNSGQISLCHSSFVAIGAYTTAILCTAHGVSYWIAAPVAVALTGVIGTLLGYPARRLSGIYLALATFGFLQIVQIMLEEFPDITGGVRGLPMSKPVLFGAVLGSDHRLYYLVMPVMLFMIWVAVNIRNSRIGRSFNAIRQSPHAAQAIGISVGNAKLAAFGTSAVYAAVGGVLLAPVVGFLEPLEFGVVAAIRYVTFVVVGGVGYISGSIVGAVILSALPEVLRGVKDYLEFISAAILLLFLLFMPSGLVMVWHRLRQRVLGVGPSTAGKSH